MKLKRFEVALTVLLLALALIGVAACADDGTDKVKPAISGVQTMTLTEGYDAVSTGAFTVSGTDVTVTKTSGNEKITWNNDTKKLDIAAGLTAGTYSVVLTASNGTASEDAKLTFTLTVLASVRPGISGEDSLALEVGYATISSDAFTITGKDVTVTKTSGDEKITWNNDTKKLDIAAGLAVGEYPVVLTASNGDTTEDAAFTFTFVVWEKPTLEGPTDIRLMSGYAATDAAFTVTGSNVTVTKTSGDEKITWNNDTKKLNIAAGLAAGKYPVTLQSEHAYAPVVTFHTNVIVNFSDAELDGCVLSSFDKDGYEHNAEYAATWLGRPFRGAEVVDDAAAPHGKALKISYTEGDSLDEACVEIYLAKPVRRSDISQLTFTLRVENFTVIDNLYNMLIYKNRETPWGVPSRLVIATDAYAAYTVAEANVLDAMADPDGYIRSVHLETFGGTEARYLYLAEIASRPYSDASLTGNCLGSFDTEAYQYNVGPASSVHPAYSPNPASVTVADGALSVTYNDTSRTEFWTRIYFGKAVRRSDISALKFTIRLENNTGLGGGDIKLIFFGNTPEWAIDGKYAHPVPVDNVYTLSDAGVLDAMTDSDGYIRSVALVSFGGQQTLHIDNIEYVSAT